MYHNEQRKHDWAILVKELEMTPQDKFAGRQGEAGVCFLFQTGLFEAPIGFGAQ